MKGSDDLLETVRKIRSNSNKQRIVVTVASSMSSFSNFTVTVPVNATVGEFKDRCASTNYRVSRQMFVYNGRELKNDEAPISEYGMTSDCTVRVVARMEAGRQSSSSLPSSMQMAKIVLFAPLMLPEPSKSMTDLRRSIRGLNNRNQPPPRRLSSSSNQCSPQTNAEYMQTRKRLREIYEKRRKYREAKAKDGKPEKKDQKTNKNSPSPTLSTATSATMPSSGLSPRGSPAKSSTMAKTSPSLKSLKDDASVSGSTGLEDSSALSTSSSQSSIISSLVTTPGTIAQRSSEASSMPTDSERSTVSNLSTRSNASRWSRVSRISGYMDAGSVCGSVSHSPVSSMPSTPERPKSELSTEPPVKGMSPNKVPSDEDIRPMTKKELLSFFDIPETRQEFDMIRRSFYDPPQNREELQEVKKSMSALCGICRRRLPVAARSIVCACGTSYCNRHRHNHNCSVDYKFTERGQIEQRNPKIGNGGLRKGQEAPEQ